MFVGSWQMKMSQLFRDHFRNRWIAVFLKSWRQWNWTHSSINRKIFCIHFVGIGFGSTSNNGFLFGADTIHTLNLHNTLMCIWIFFAQLLRVQSPEGTKRIEILPSATVRQLYESIHDAFELDSYNFAVYGERNYKNELSSSRSQTVDDYKLKHGDMVFVKPLSAGSSTVSSKLSSVFLKWGQ